MRADRARRAPRRARLGAWLVLLAVAQLGTAGLAPPASAAPGVRELPRGEAHAGAQRRRRRRRVRIAPSYRRMRTRWHARAPVSERKAWNRSDPKPLVLRPVARNGRFTLLPVDAEGGFDAPDRLALAREALAYRKDGSSAPVHPRLLALVYRAVLRFEVPYVHVVSGYRPTRETSRHAQGRAIDFVLPGVSDGGLAAFLRRQGFVGVGLYTVSGFVHLDVRDQSYFWVDRSAPGGRQRNRRILPELGWRADAAARRRGELPVPDALPDEEEYATDGAPSDADPGPEADPAAEPEPDTEPDPDADPDTEPHPDTEPDPDADADSNPALAPAPEA